ncbi:hypothetical protein [Bdellovibrio sp.]|uniref:hypothetical protein n=1 Tax=Bdellovibrio sp. TaxID=28201 RepID=UPI00322162E3
MSHLVPLLPIKEDMRGEIIFDGTSVGIKYLFSSNSDDSSFYTKLKKVSKEAKTRLWIRTNSPAENSSINFDIENDSFIGEDSVNSGGKQSEKIVIFYLNDNNNGNLILLDYICSNFAKELEHLNIDIGKLKPLDARPAKRHNFVSAVVRQSPIWGSIKSDMQKIVSEGLVNALNETQKVIENGLASAFSDAACFIYDSYVFNTVEICLDILTPVGLHWAEEPEVALRLSRLLSVDRRGLYTNWGGANVLMPDILAKLLYKNTLQLQRLFGHQISSGVSAFYGHFEDHSSLYVATKEIPTVPCSWGLPLESNRAWLTRLEWRINRDVRLSDPGSLLCKYAKTKNFKNGKELSCLLDNLYHQFFRTLQMSLNVPFYLSDEVRSHRIRKIIDYYMPTSSNTIGDILCKYGRITQHHSGLSSSEVDRAKEIGLLRKEDNHQGTDLILDQEFF